METANMEGVPQPPASSTHQDGDQDSQPDSQQHSHPHSHSDSHPVSLQGDHPDNHSDSRQHTHVHTHPDNHHDSLPDSHQASYSHSHRDSNPESHQHSHQASHSHSHQDSLPLSDTHQHSHQASYSHSHQHSLPLSDSHQASYSHSLRDDHPDTHQASYSHSHQDSLPLSDSHQASYSHSLRDDYPDTHQASYSHSHRNDHPDTHQASYSHSHRDDHPDNYQQRHQHSPPDSDESELPSGTDPPYSPFEFEDYYNYQSLGSGYRMDYDNYYSSMGNNPNLTDSEEDLHNKVDGFRERPYTYEQQPEGAYPRFLTSQSSEEEEGKEEKQKKVDPGTFRYNKRVFITALPCLLLTLLMTGETLLLLGTTGGLVIVLMAHSGEDVGKRCVVVFVLLFIPCHVIVVGTVVPLLWLSVWNVLLIGIVNMFCVLTGGWIIIQFAAFRTEEPSLCATIERGLFSIYPFLCSALVAWILSTVVSLPLTPFLFIFIWFVCLQLYLVPAPSSFTLTKKEEEKEGGKEEEEGVLREATMLTLVLVFIMSGPLLHVTLTLITPSLSLFNISSLTLLAMLVCVGLFLSTLLHTRQLCDYLGWRHIKVVQARWASGVGVVLLSYPVLQQLGMTSHFLLSLPVAVAGFASLGLTLSLKKGKVLPLVLMVVLLILLCLWISHLPWTLTYYLLGALSLTNFYLLVGVNFMLCVLAIYVSWHASPPLLGWLLLLQAFGQTVCELGLYQAGLYPLPTYQLTGILAAYTLHRLHLAGKLSPALATASTAVHLTKTTTGMLGYLLRGEGRGGVVEVGLSDFCCMLMLVAVLLWLFVYTTPQHVTLWQAGKDVTLLMVSLGLSAQSFLLPLGDFLLQDDLTLADLVGLWYGVGGVLMMLYALQHGGGGGGGEGEKEGAVDQLMKVAMVMGGVGALVMVMQPQFVFTAYAVYQWCEVVSVLLTAGLLVTRVDMSLTKIIITSACLAPCPTVHATISLYGDIATVLHYVLLSTLCWLLLSLVFMVVKIGQVTDAVERAIKAGAVLSMAVLVAVLGVDVVNFEYMDTVWDYPAWSLMMAVSASLSAALKSLALKLGPQHLPLLKKEDHSVPLIPVISNVFTVLTFLLATTQGPIDSLLHDLWCCAWSLFLVFLQRDALLLSSLSPGNRATPMVLTTITTLVLSTLLQSQLWGFESMGGVVWGCLEVLVVLLSLPVYVVLAGILWRGEIWSEKAVVFTMPLNALLLVVGSSYTSWLLCVAGLVCGLGMMIFKLPLLPYNFEPVRR